VLKRMKADLIASQLKS